MWRGRCDQGRVFSLRGVSPKRYPVANTRSNMCVYAVCCQFNLKQSPSLSCILDSTVSSIMLSYNMYCLVTWLDNTGCLETEDKLNTLIWIASILMLKERWQGRFFWESSYFITSLGPCLWVGELDWLPGATQLVSCPFLSRGEKVGQKSLAHDGHRSHTN